MKIAIMQPYFLPYIGYFQLMAAVDVFVVYDNIKYTKKGWINRNQLLQDGAGAVFSIPLRADSDFLHVCQRSVAENFEPQKLLNRFKGAYGKAPYWETVGILLKQMLSFEDRNLFRFIANSLDRVQAYLGIKTSIVVSSTLPIDHELKSQDKVLAICRHLQADTYINSVGGRELYSPEVFNRRGIDLRFLQARLSPYKQFDNAFVPSLSIADVMAFNSLTKVREMLGNFDLT